MQISDPVTEAKVAAAQEPSDAPPLPPVETPDRQFVANESESFSHALYHHVAHWAAYVAMMGFLITIPLLLSLSPIEAEPIARRGTRIIGLLWTISAALAGAFYFVLFGMNKYGRILNKRLSNRYLGEMLTLRHWLMTVVQCAMALLFAVFDIWLVWRLLD